MSGGQKIHSQIPTKYVGIVILSLTNCAVIIRYGSLERNNNNDKDLSGLISSAVAGK